MVFEREKTLNNDGMGRMIRFSLVFLILVRFVMKIFGMRVTIFVSKDDTDAGHEGVRVYLFSPDTTIYNKNTSAKKIEVDPATQIDLHKIQLIVVPCRNSTYPVVTFAQLAACRLEKVIRLTIPDTLDMILGVCFYKPITINRSMEMVNS
jgi:hypothetical protein